LQACILSWNIFPSLFPHISRLERHSSVTTQFIRSLRWSCNLVRLYLHKSPMNFWVKSELVKVILYIAFASCQNYLSVIIIMYSSHFSFTSQGKAQKSKRCASYKYISESSE